MNTGRLDVDTQFPDIAAMSDAELNQERKRLVGDRTSHKELSDDDLHRLAAVLHRLRAGKSGPPKKAKTKKIDSNDLDALAALA